MLRLTHSGAVFKRHADAVLHQLDDGLAAVSELLDPETGTVALAFQPSLGTWLVPALIADFSARHPRVRFRLEQSQDSCCRALSPVAASTWSSRLDGLGARRSTGSG
ncbi:MAG: hypothetical protein M3116_01750 [Actinomycetota bacterium]|nr:hypothetical protein [Actinomycetota bacterium]